MTEGRSASTAELMREHSLLFIYYAIWGINMSAT